MNLVYAAAYTTMAAIARTIGFFHVPDMSGKLAVVTGGALQKLQGRAGQAAQHIQPQSKQLPPTSNWRRVCWTNEVSKQRFLTI